MEGFYLAKVLLMLFTLVVVVVAVESLGRHYHYSSPELTMAGIWFCSSVFLLSAASCCFFCSLLSVILLAFAETLVLSSRQHELLLVHPQQSR
eukprot:m.40513 g.40513  ORF g.40513 m.40513 type:complete len:93 (-) comp11727_c0_seq1:869-1147(-)